MDQNKANTFHNRMQLQKLHPTARFVPESARGVVAQTRAVDGTRKFTTLGHAIQTRLVETQVVAEEAAAKPVTQGLTLAAPVAPVLTMDYQGAFDPPGQVPFVLTPVVKYLDADFLTDPRVTYVIEKDGVTTTEVGGVVTVTGMTKLTGYVRWLISLDGVAQKPIQTNINVTKADPPPPPPDEISIQQALQNATSTVNTILADFGPVRADTFKLSLISTFVSAAGYTKNNSNCSVQVGILPAGDTIWTMIGAEILGNPSYVEVITENYAEYGFGKGKQFKAIRIEEPGSVNAVFDFVIPSNNTRVALWGKLTYGNPIQFLGKALLET